MRLNIFFFGGHMRERECDGAARSAAGPTMQETGETTMSRSQRR